MAGQTMKPLLFCVILLITVNRLVAQEIGYIDLSDSDFHESTWPHHWGAGGCGGVDHPVRESSLPAITVRLLSLDKARYSVGEDATFETRIQNTGKTMVTVPWTPNLADLEPPNAVASHTYLSGAVSLGFRDSENREFWLIESLYGEAGVAGSLRELRPGEWFTVRGRKR